MNIQSFSIVVPNKECMNKCPFCVSRMVNSNIYPNLISIDHSTYDYNVREYLKRMKYVADSGCKTLMLTGTSEPQQNKQFLNTFALLHEILGKPFTNIEMQTTGVLLDKRPDYLRFLKNFVGVNTVAVSLSSIFKEINSDLIGNYVDVKELCRMLKDYGFNVRICCNLTKCFDNDESDPQFLLGFLKKDFYADQVTFRKMYVDSYYTEQGKWLERNKIDERYVKRLAKYLMQFPVACQTVYGTDIRYIGGMSVIFDDDCMGKSPKKDNTVKYLILRPNCKLYSSWDDPASLVF